MLNYVPGIILHLRYDIALLVGTSDVLVEYGQHGPLYNGTNQALSHRRIESKTLDVGMELIGPSPSYERYYSCKIANIRKVPYKMFLVVHLHIKRFPGTESKVNTSRIYTWVWMELIVPLACYESY